MELDFKTPFLRSLTTQNKYFHILISDFQIKYRLPRKIWKG